MWHWFESLNCWSSFPAGKHRYDQKTPESQHTHTPDHGSTSSHNFGLYHLPPDAPVPLLLVIPLSSGVGESLIHVALPHTVTAALVLVVCGAPVLKLFKGGVSDAASPQLRVWCANLFSAPWPSAFNRFVRANTLGGGWRLTPLSPVVSPPAIYKLTPSSSLPLLFFLHPAESQLPVSVRHHPPQCIPVSLQHFLPSSPSAPGFAAELTVGC